MSGMVSGWRYLLGTVVGSAWLLTANYATAQITPDRSLPNNSSVTINGSTFNITGGTQAGRNLFHSFQQFSVPTNNTAIFNNGLDIQNIITRVTGGGISNIDGILRASGSANLFLINPAGIVFGKNARLDIGGSFVASTANSIKFTDGFEYSATTPQTTPLLTISVPSGLQFGTNPGRINVQGDGQGIRQDTHLIDTQNALRVKPNQTLALVGGDITLEGGTLKTAGGRIELGSVTGNSLVNLTPINKGFSLGYEGVQNFGNIQLSQQSDIDASGEGGGDIQVQARKITLTGGSQIEASTLGANSGGTLTVTASDAVELTGSTTDKYFTGMFAEVYSGANGNGGNLIINTGSLSLRGVSARIDVNNDGNGNAGNIVFNANNISISHSQVSASTFSTGNAGNLTIHATNSVELSGEIPGTGGNPGFPGGLFAQVDVNGVGHGGNLTIDTKRLSVSDGSKVQVATFGQGDAGDLLIRASKVDVFEFPNKPSFYITGIFAGIETSPQNVKPAKGNGGSLIIETGRLSITNGGRVTADTYGVGNAGKVLIQATDSVEVMGRSARHGSSSLGATVQQGATGQGGDLIINTGQLIVKDRGQVGVSSQGRGDAGKLDVVARSIQLDNLGKIIAQTTSGNGGNITLTIQDLLLLRNNSQISTTAGTSSTNGNGGNITINVPNGFIVTAPNENNDITANAYLGSGGKVQINALGMYNFNERSLENLEKLLGTTDPSKLNTQLLRTNDITAISLTNPTLSGQINIITPDIDPSRGLIPLPTVTEQNPKLVSSGCAAFNEAEGGSQFIITGRGGLPPGPDQPLTSEAIWTDTRLPVTTAQQHQHKTHAAKPKPQPIAIIPATGWVRNDKGEVTLISTATNATAVNTPTSCPIR
jgi:filamentous hemagglutinin family protein